MARVVARRLVGMSAVLFAVSVVEVHLSDITSREEWRRVSVIEDVVDHRVIGKGPDGYQEALVFLAHKGKVRR